MLVKALRVGLGQLIIFTDRQVNKKRRLMSHHKKADKKRRDKR